MSDQPYKDPQAHEEEQPLEFPPEQPVINEAGAPIGEIRGYFLVRDAAGNVCCDDLKTMPRQVWEIDLTDTDRQYLTELHGVENIPTGE